MALEERLSIDWKAAFVAGISTAGVAFAPLPALPTGARQVSENCLSVWDEAAMVERYAESLGRFPGMLLTVGSGSRYQLRDHAFTLANATGGELREHPSTSKNPSELVAEIRASLVLQIKELAEIVGVERPTIYAWIKDHAAPQRHNSSRLRQVYRIAQAWERLSRYPAGAVMRDMDDDGRSLIDYLKEDPIPEETILSRFRAVAASARVSVSSERPSVREVANERGIDLSRIKDQTEVIDVTTGKRASPE